VTGTPTEANPYHYADNDPLNKVDPTGDRPTDARDQRIEFDLGQDAKSRFGRLGKVEMSGFIPDEKSALNWVPSPWDLGPEAQLYEGDNRFFQYPIPQDRVRFYASFDFASGKGSILVRHTCAVTGDCYPAWPITLTNGRGDIFAGDASAETHSDFWYSCCDEGRMKFSWSVIHGDSQFWQSYVPGMRPAFRGDFWLGLDDQGGATAKYEGHCFPSVEAYQGDGKPLFRMVAAAPSSATWFPGATRHCDEHDGI